jgi:hypothetical protein
MKKGMIAKWQNFRGQIKDHFSKKKMSLFLNQLFILIPRETDSTKTAPNLIQMEDQIYLLSF